MFRLILLIAFVLTLAACHRQINPGSIDSIDDLEWLAGSWASDQDGVLSEEHWTAPAGGTMLGVNRTIEDSQTVFFEYLRIEERADGIFYLASPRGRQPPTEFKLVAIVPEKDGADHVIFENPDHDFPQRITYFRPGRWSWDGRSSDELHGIVEGVENGQARRETWAWKRMKRGKSAVRAQRNPHAAHTNRQHTHQTMASRACLETPAAAAASGRERLRSTS